MKGPRLRFVCPKKVLDEGRRNHFFELPIFANTAALDRRRRPFATFALSLPVFHNIFLDGIYDHEAMRDRPLCLTYAVHTTDCLGLLRRRDEGIQLSTEKTRNELR